jgi:hypothetical protein
MAVTPEYGLAVAVVKRWLAEKERADRVGRRYRQPNAAAMRKITEATERLRAAADVAFTAIAALPDRNVELDGRRFWVCNGELVEEA